ncbi:hypothetical protein HID58_077820, partial [Brassica napus]
RNYKYRKNKRKMLTPTTRTYMVLFFLDNNQIESSTIPRRHLNINSNLHILREQNRYTSHEFTMLTSWFLNVFFLVLASSTRDLITIVGGPFYEVKLGRKDGFESKAHKVHGNIPIANHTVHDMMSIFKKNGFSLKEMVALSGGHTVGFAHCIEFSSRLFGPRADPELDSRYADRLKDLCKDHMVNKSMAAFLDPITPGKFDNMYFKNLKRGLGLLASDHALFKDNGTRPFVDLYADNQTAFFEDFARAMEKLGMVGVKGDKDGEVRRKCDHFNKLDV